MHFKTTHFMTLIHNRRFLIIAGLCLATIAMLPYLLLGQGSIITYHDQLDGELLSYILSARYLFTNITVYPEIMNGLPANGAVAPAPLFVLLYKLFSPFPAFLLSQWIINLIGFTGMFLLLSLLTARKHELLSFLLALCFMLLPFYPVYGLCIPGIPLLLYAFLHLTDPEQSRHAAPYLLIFGYGLCSSLVLVGFGVLLATVLLGIIFQIKKSHSLSRYWLGVLLLLAAYLLTNYRLILQILFPQTGYISHKTEIVLSPQGCISSFCEAFLNGISYAQSFHRILLLPVLAALLIMLVAFLQKLLSGRACSASVTYYAHRILPLFLGILLICVFYAFYHGTFITALRNNSHGVFREFNLDRIAWLLPVCWFILAGWCCAFLLEYAGKERTLLLRKTALLLLLGIWGLTIAWHSSLKPNVAKLLKGGNYYALDWQSFFACDIYDQINAAIGKPQDSYHVVSLGIYPAAAAYNGFYCLDGYSNNYPLSYKHTFRKIIAGELQKSDYVRTLFDNWGNRCYITTAEQNDYYTFEKKWNSVINHLDLNISELQQLDCEYLFSAAYIMNAQDLGLTLLQKQPFETEGSWYHIYVYKIPQ